MPASHDTLGIGGVFTYVLGIPWTYLIYYSLGCSGEILQVPLWYCHYTRLPLPPPAAARLHPWPAGPMTDLLRWMGMGRAPSGVNGVRANARIASADINTGGECGARGGTASARTHTHTQRCGFSPSDPPPDCAVLLCMQTPRALFSRSRTCFLPPSLA